MQAIGYYKGILHTVSIKADIDILPNMQKTSDAQPNFCMMKKAEEIGVG